MTAGLAAGIAVRRVRRCGPGGGAERRRHERELAMLYQRDPASRDDVVRALLPLAQAVARRFRRGEEPADDLEQVAVVGLLKALRGFDAARGGSFASYAIPTMSGELRRHYRDTGWAVHVPRGTQELALRVAKAEQAAAAEGRPVTAAAIAERLDCEVDAVLEARTASGAMRTRSLDVPARDEESDGPSAGALYGDEDDGFAAAENRATLQGLTRSLTQRDRRVLALRYAGDLSQSEIGRRIGLSQMQVSRILRRAIDDLHEQAAAG